MLDKEQIDGMAATDHPEPVAVKPLVWDENANGMWIGQPPVRLGELAFWVFRTSQGFIRHTKAGRETHPSLEAAQAAAQADYEPLIRACLIGGAA